MVATDKFARFTGIQINGLILLSKDIYSVVFYLSPTFSYFAIYGDSVWDPYLDLLADIIQCL